MLASLLLSHARQLTQSGLHSIPSIAEHVLVLAVVLSSIIQMSQMISCPALIASNVVFVRAVAQPVLILMLHWKASPFARYADGISMTLCLLWQSATALTQTS
jgi:hypothetical protein